MEQAKNIDTFGTYHMRPLPPLVVLPAGCANAVVGYGTRGTLSMLLALVGLPN